MGGDERDPPFFFAKHADMVAPDGALWMVEDSVTGGLFRVTPAGK